jgi:hypothetical protein
MNSCRAVISESNSNLLACIRLESGYLTYRSAPSNVCSVFYVDGNDVGILV